MRLSISPAAALLVPLSLGACAADGPLGAGSDPAPGAVTASADVVAALDDGLGRILPAYDGQQAAVALGSTVFEARTALVSGSPGLASTGITRARAEVERVFDHRPLAIDPADLDALRLALDAAAESLDPNAVEVR